MISRIVSAGATLLLLGSVFVQAQTPVPVQIAEPEMYDDSTFSDYLIDEGAYCSFSDQEQETMRMVHELFVKHGDTRIAQRLFSDTETKELVNAYIEEFMKKIEGSLEMCNDYGYGAYGAFREYSEFESGLIDFIAMLKELKLRENQKLDIDPVSESFDAFRDIVLGDSEDFFLTNGWISKTSKVLFDMSMESTEGSVDLEFDIDGTSVGTKDASSLDASVGVGGAMHVEMEGATINTTGAMSANMKILDGHLYIQLREFDIELGDIEFQNQYDAEGFNGMLAGVNLIKGKYIDIPLMPEDQDGFYFNPFMMVGEVIDQQETIASMMYTDWLTTVSVDGDTSIAGLNPVACAAMKDMAEVGNCLQARSEMRYLPGNGGMFFMKEVDGVTQMGIVKEFAEAIEDDMAIQLAGLPLVSFTDTDVVQVQIPLFEDGAQVGTINYEDNALLVQGEFTEDIYNSGTGEFEESKILVNVKGKHDSDTMNLVGSVQGRDQNAQFSMNLDGSIESMVGDFSLNVADTSAYPMTLQLKMTLGQDMQDITPAVITKPEDREILSLEDLMRL